MNPRREISERAIGKHIGHACEGHLGGILTHLPDVSQNQVTRRLSFDFPVEPDIVLLDESEKVRAVLIVAFWDNAHNSDAKFYRTRLEYNEMVRAYQEHLDRFSDSFALITFIYGSEGGWKEQILEDLAVQCAPLIFLPSMLGGGGARDIVQRAFDVYREVWESGCSNTREEVEKRFAESDLTSDEIDLLEAIQGMLSVGTRDKMLENASRSSDSVIVPDGSFNTRLRQGLGVLSLFAPEEIEAWLSSGQQLANNLCENFARRAFFLDMGIFAERKSLLGSFAHFALRRPVRVENDREVYAPALPDFRDWTRIDYDSISKILKSHRLRTHNPTNVFRGGTYDQIAGNWKEICHHLTTDMPVLINALEDGKREDFAHVLCNEKPVTAPDWHPGHSMSYHFPLWAFAVCAVAIERNRRSVRGAFNARRQEQPTLEEAEGLFEVCYSESIGSLLRGLVEFSRILQAGELLDLCKVERPLLLSLDEPCSWIADFYNTLATNSSHNPLNEVVYLWLRSKFPDLEWHGWPKRRSRSLRQVVGPVTGRRQWQFIGIDQAERMFCAAEVKSITQNHWGDKSKELYDRVAETRAGAREIGWQNHTVCVLDGDIGTEQIEELKTGIGHDEIVCIDQLLEEYQEYDKPDGE
ncbi:MAG: hypothetical protein GY832_35270 [Chloroflexi bacterium]|nr:hypothetical protein [Chloroflexota bacterium]